MGNLTHTLDIKIPKPLRDGQAGREPSEMELPKRRVYGASTTQGLRWGREGPGVVGMRSGLPAWSACWISRSHALLV